MGSAMLEQLAVSERHRYWIDHVSQLFGGLDICAIELLVGKDGREYIIEVNDSALSLMGDSQEEDRRHIADLVTAKMQVRTLCKLHGEKRKQQQPIILFANGALCAAVTLGADKTTGCAHQDGLARLNVGIQPDDKPRRGAAEQQRATASPASGGSDRIARQHGLDGELRQHWLHGVGIRCWWRSYQHGLLGHIRQPSAAQSASAAAS